MAGSGTRYAALVASLTTFWSVDLTGSTILETSMSGRQRSAARPPCLGSTVSITEGFDCGDRLAMADEDYLFQVGTLSGNPVASIAGLATLEVLRRPGAYRLVDPDGHGHTAVCISASLPERPTVRYRPSPPPRKSGIAPQPLAASARRV